MPAPVSRKQYRLMQAILHAKHVRHGSRGVPPKSVAAKYVSGVDPKDLPEQSGQNRGGTWDKDKHEKARAKVKEERAKRKKSKKELKKAFEDFYSGKAAATIIMDNNGKFLLGSHCNGGLAFPGGHMDAADIGTEYTALREMLEESGLQGHNPQKIMSSKIEGNDVDIYLVESFVGKPKATKEVKDWKWYEPQDIEWNKLRDCCVEPLKHFIESKLGKSLKGMMALENLSKNIIRQRGDAVLEVTHGDALKLVGTSLFRKLKEEVSTMTDEDFKDIILDTYVISIRKHMNDIYSGRVVDGHKQIYQFTNKSLPELTAALMSVFEWYLPEDEKILDNVHEDAIEDDVLEGGLHQLVDNYKRHNIGNIYEEMETIREHIRNGVAVDLQQVENRIVKLFEKLETVVQDIADKHNKLAEQADSELLDIESKLRELQNKIESLEKKPEVVEAYSVAPANPQQVHDNSYPYLPRPQVEISPDGKIKITFASDWTSLEKENFLRDMRAKTLKR